VRSRAIHELEPRIAASRALEALLEAGKYSGHGLSTAGGRLGRRAAAARVEAALRTGDAWAALRGAPPPRRRYGFLTVAVTAGCAAVAALAVRRGIVVWRAQEPGTEFAQRLRGALHGTAATQPPDSDSDSDTSAEQEPAALPDTESHGATGTPAPQGTR